MFHINGVVTARSSSDLFCVMRAREHIAVTLLRIQDVTLHLIRMARGLI